MRKENSTISIVDYNNAQKLGIKVRRTMRGPETDLVDKFLNQKNFIVPSGYHMTIFKEPRLESGFPDLVLVLWNTEAANKWDKQRAKLKNEDLRVMQFICHGGSVAYSMLIDFFSNKVRNNLDRLCEAKMINISCDEFTAKPLSESFAVRSILAIEAKIKEWTKALQQAFINTWFSSESYLLIPQISSKSHLFERAESKGIGILTNKKENVIMKKHPSNGLPRSYASWLFNEWSWRNEIIG